MSALGTALTGLLCAAAGHALEVGEVRPLVAGDGAIHDRDLFGSAVAIDGDTLVVASRGGDGLVEGSGLAQVFVRGADGLWAVQAELRATGGESGDGFGTDVAIEENTVVIGTRGAEAACVFDRDPGSGAWRETTRLTPWQTDDQARLFGRAISLHGNTIAVGASEIRGAVYLFARDPSGGWSPRQKLLPLDRDDSVSRFGYSLAQLGDTLLVGAAYAGGSQGAAYAFSREAPGVEPWVQTAKTTSRRSSRPSSRGLGDQGGAGHRADPGDAAKEGLDLGMVGVHVLAHLPIDVVELGADRPDHRRDAGAHRRGDHRQFLPESEVDTVSRTFPAGR